MRKLKIGIAGYGKMGQIRERTIQESGEAEVAAIYDVEDHEHSDERIKLCNSYQELLESDVDAIVISVYAKVAAEYAIKALNAGKHVLCEKPPSTSAKEMLQVIEAEKASQKVLKYGFNHRFHFSVMEAKKLIDDGSMGKLLWMRGVYGKAGSIDFDQNWRNYKEYSGGGILLDQGIHMLDLFRYFSAGEFECLSSCLTKSYWKTEFEDNAFLILKSKNDNVVATLHSTANQWKHKFLLEMTFEHGYVNLDGLLSSTRSYVPETLIVGRREFEDVTFAMGKPKETTTYFENDKSWELELDEFVGAIRNVSSILNGTSDDALEIMKITDCVYGNSKETSS